MDIYSFAAVSFAALFPIVNPLGAVPLFFALTRGLNKHDLRNAEMRIALYTAGLLLVFLVAGPLVLKFFGISLGVLKIAGGLIVGNTAWSMVTGSKRINSDEHADAMTKEDFTFTPMSMPMLSGPGAIGVVIGLAATAERPLDTVGIAIGILLLGIVVYLVLRASEPLSSRLGPSAVGAINRIFGFFILAIAVQLLWNGYQTLIKPS